MDLNKMTGYAITGLVTDTAGRLVDPRINFESPLLTGEATLADFRASLTGVEEVMLRGRELADDEPCRAVVHNAVEGIPGVLVVRPVAQPSWHRVGDDLDRAGEAGTPDHAASRLEVLEHGLWPYSNLFMDAVTGTELGGGVTAWVKATAGARGVVPVDELDAAARDSMTLALTGFATFEEAKARIVPAVPSPIRTLLTWGRLFTDPSTVRDLRPALYTWWC